MNLPQDLLQFLGSGKQLEYDIEKAEPGFVGLCEPDELKEEVIWMEGPNPGKSYYQIPAVSITNENEYYEPEFILCWLPRENCYATWDCDHWSLYIFDGTSWNDIVSNPLPYINCQWDHGQTVGRAFNPAGKYGLIEGWPALTT